MHSLFHFELEILYWDFASYFLISNFKRIQHRVFAGLKDLKRKPQFSSCLIDPKCQTNALLFFLTFNHISEA